MQTKRRCANLHQAMLFALILIMIIPASAFAASAWDSDEADHVDKDIQQLDQSNDGNQGYAKLGKDAIGAGNQVSASGSIDGNFLMSGQTVAIRDSHAANAFIAGQTLNITDSKLSGDIGAAGQAITVNGTTVDGNVFAAGQQITLSLDKAYAIKAAGQTVSVSAAHAESADIGADTVYLSGTFDGDVSVDASNITIAEGTVVKGTLYVSSKSEPAFPESASINEYRFTQSADSGALEGLAFDPLAATGILGALGFAVGILGMLALMAALLGLCSDRPFKGSLDMARQRTAPMLVSGLVAFIAIPAVALLCLVSLIGWRIGALVALGAFAVAALSGTFTAISLGRLVFPKMNKWLSSLIMVLIFALLMKVPVLGMVLGACCDIYLLGYLIQLFWMWRTHLDDASQPTAASLPPDQR